ncbi:MAG: aminotransferase class V-fold PLP-dependent enzyme [Cytophagales bacterium]|nr:aminotransferase class V-fold PLP-dependent enzyme [Cytophagales bacterium]
MSLIATIQALEKESAVLSPNEIDRASLRESVLKITEDFLQEIGTSPVYGKDETGKRTYERPLKEPEGWEDLLSKVKDELELPGINAASGRHLGYIPGGGIYLGALGDYIAAVYNKYQGVFFASPGGVRMENQLIQWMGDLVGYPEGFAGNLTSGGSIANLTAVVTARDAHHIKGRDIERTVIYVSEQMHHCLNKAFRIAGMGEAIIRQVPLDEHFKLRPDALEHQIKSDISEGLKPWLVIASAGTTDTGVIDPLQEVGEIAQRYDCWYHIDGAYGGFFLLSEEVKAQLKGIELSDSVVMDPHKSMFIPYGIGAVVIRDRRKLYQSHYYMANYMQDTLEAEEISPADLSPELTKHFRALRMWLPLKLYGLEPFKACLSEKIHLARYFHVEISKRAGFEVGPFPDLSVVYFRYLPKTGMANAFNEKLVKLIMEDGRVFLSSTVLHGNYVIRCAVVSFRTHLTDVDLALQVIDEKVAELEA